jgi:plasmid stabilization system protein ParE
MRRFRVLLVPQAQRQIEEIHDFIFSELKSPKAAASTEDAIIDAVMSLETMPERGHLREVGPYADGKHRVLRVKSYYIIYSVEGDAVYILAVHYSARDF